MPVQFRRYLPALLTLLLLSPKTTLAGPWTVGVGPGVTSRYTYQSSFTPFPGVVIGDKVFDNSFLPGLGIERKLGEHLSLYSALDNFRNDGLDQISVNMTGISIGLRRPLGPAGPFLEFLPSAYVGRWTDTAFNHSMTSVRPGFQVGGGVRGPMFWSFGFEMNVGFRYSTDWPNVRHEFYPTHLGDSSDYVGLRQMTAGMKLTYAL